MDPHEQMIPSSLQEPGSFFDWLSSLENPGVWESSVSEQFNWSALIDQAGRLSISSLVYDRVKSNGMLAHVPPALASQWKLEVVNNQAQNMFRLGRLKEILNLFSLENIPVIVLKGAALAEIVYPQLGLRPMRDVDLLIKEEDISRAEQLLQARGFFCADQGLPKEWYDSHHHIVPYVSADQMLTLELHHHLIAFTMPVFIPTEDLWERALSVQLAGVACWILSPEDFLIHLALHTACDGFLGKVRVLYDIAEIMKQFRNELDWGALLMLSEKYGVSKFLFYVLWVAQVRMHAGVPDFVLNDLFSKFQGLPLEDRLLKNVLQKVLVYHDASQHPFYFWLLSTFGMDVLSNQGRGKKIGSIFNRSTQRYREFSREHARQNAASPFWNLAVGYPMYLLRKAFGLSSTKFLPHKKS